MDDYLYQQRSEFRCRVSGVSAAAGQKNSRSDRKRNFVVLNHCFWIVGAVFNRDYPGNRGRRPLPPTIDYNLNNIEFSEVSYKRRRWPEKRPV
jgi:hypothetical protein